MLTIMVFEMQIWGFRRNHSKDSADFVAQMAEQSLPASESPGSNPAISNFYKERLFSAVCWKNENKEKDAGNGPF